MAKIFRALKSPSLAIDGTADHVHILFSLGRVIKVADLVEEVKTESSKWIKIVPTELLPALRIGQGGEAVREEPSKRSLQ